MSHVSPHSDLPLTALRYAAGELSGAELAEFEAQLETDFDAQVALAEAVQLVSALASRSSVVVRRRVCHPVRDSRRRSRWFAVLSGGIVAAAMLIVIWQGSEPSGTGAAISENAAADATLSAWAVVQLEDADVSEPDEAAALLAFEEELSAEEENIEDAEIVPDWLLAAVELSDLPSGPDGAEEASSGNLGL